MKRMEKTRGPHHDSRGEIRMLIETWSATRNPAGALLNERRIIDPPTGSLEGGAVKHCILVIRFCIVCLGSRFIRMLGFLLLTLNLQ